MQLLLMISAVRKSSANRITAVIPYYGYARQDRKVKPRVPISAADVAKLLETMGVDRVLTVDLHSGQIMGMFGQRINVDNLAAGVVALEHLLTETDIDFDNTVVVSPDAGGVTRAKLFRSGLVSRGFSPKLAMIVKQRAEASIVTSMDLIGDVAGKDCIIVDDMIDTAGTLCKAADILKENGA